MATKKTSQQTAADKATEEKTVKDKAEAAIEKEAAEVGENTTEEKEATDRTEADRKAAEEKQAAVKDPYKALVAQYKKSYPKNTKLHITTDMQVFLESDKNLAQLHQRSLGGDGEVKTFKTK